MSIEPTKLEDGDKSATAAPPPKAEEPTHLCQFEEKKCQQRCHKSYAYCFRHILCDKNAPFKQCTFVVSNKNKSHPCSAAVEINSVQPYCNKHQCDLGLKERKKTKRFTPKTVLNNSIKPIPKKCRLMYSNDKLDPRVLFQFVKKSDANNYRYGENSMELLYRSVFNDEKAEENFENNYNDILQQSINSYYYRNIKFKKNLSYCSKNIEKIIKQMKSIKEEIHSAYNYGIYAGGNKKSQCTAKISAANSSNGKPFKCTNKAVVGMIHCLQHMKLNKKQVLFNFCRFRVKTNNEVCGNIVIGKKLKKNRNVFCEKHQNMVDITIPLCPKPSSSEPKSRSSVPDNSTNMSVPQSLNYSLKEKTTEITPNLQTRNKQIEPPKVAPVPMSTANEPRQINTPKTTYKQSDDKNKPNPHIKPQTSGINIAGSTIIPNRINNNQTICQTQFPSGLLPNNNSRPFSVNVGVLSTEIGVASSSGVFSQTKNQPIKQPFQSSRFVPPIDLKSYERTPSKLNANFPHPVNIPQNSFSSTNLAPNNYREANFMTQPNQIVIQPNIYPNSNQIKTFKQSTNNRSDVYPFVNNPDSGPPNGFC